MKVEKGKVIFENGDKERHLELTDEQRDNLIVNNTNLVAYVIKKQFSNLWHFEYDDYYGYGIIGLVKAGKAYDPNVGVQFSTFAFKKIWGEINVSIRDKSGMVGDRESRANKSAPIPKPFSFFEDTYANTSNGSGDNGKRTAEEIFFETEGEDDSCAYDEIIDDMAIDSVLRLLSDDDKKIFDMYYYKDMSQAAISKEFGVSQVQISRRLKEIRSVFNYFKPVLV